MVIDIHINIQMQGGFFVFLFLKRGVDVHWKQGKRQTESEKCSSCMVFN